MLLNIRRLVGIYWRMTRFLLPLLAAAVITALPAIAEAACYADYKARRDNPLKLHYGVMQVSSCDRGAAQGEVADRLARNGWTLLNVLGTFDESGLEKRKANAGEYYLRF
ncbi:hypothetical protein GCM10011534_33800 [Pseudooceanicola nanhaiensis]|uniref:DUF4177 domain-containing protein n=2 Tax=Pseudooceanicola nanhaiensis TaxID=375761 RepID=A0A917T3L9_9RHOB|nr:hypothetical protein GCM10011534_33800 [Pseudooceanicola nanhaiensis]